VIVKQIPTLFMLTLIGSISVFTTGCGSDEPEPVTQAQFQEAQEKQREMLQKEYGPGAGKAPKRGRAAKH